MNKEIISKKITNLKRATNEDAIKFELYGIVVNLFLSKSEFPLNSDVIQFLDELKIEHKPYLLKSRTMVLGKVIRTIEKKDIDELHFYFEVIEKRINIMENQQVKEKENNKNKSKSK